MGKITGENPWPLGGSRLDGHPGVADFSLKTVTLLVFCAVAKAFSLGDTVNFDTDAYLESRGVENVDGWQRYTVGVPGLITDPPPFVIGGTANKALHCHADAASQYGVIRAFKPITGSDIGDVTWKWNAESDSVNLCVGVASQATGSLIPTPKATVCVSPEGTLSSPQGLEARTVKGKWQPDKDYFTRIKFDILKNLYSVYTSADLAKIEDPASLVFAALTLQGTPLQQVHRIFISANHGSPVYAVSIDNISFVGIRANFWTGAYTGANGLNSWYNPANWSRNALPDSNDIALFNYNPMAYPNSNKMCNLNPIGAGTPQPRVLGIGVAKTYTNTINLLADTLTVMLSADFSGGSYQSTGGVVRFAYPAIQYLIDTGTSVLPPLLQEGPGLLTLAGGGRAMTFASYRQTAGGLNLNGSDITSNGNFYVAGTPLASKGSFYGISGLYGLDGRNITVVSGTTQFLGVDTSNRMSLTTGSNLTWKLTTGGTVSARNAVIKNGKVVSQAQPPTVGNAASSVDSGGNQGWIFWTRPAITVQPKDASLMVGERAKFKITAGPSDSTHPLQYLWQRRGGNGVFAPFTPSENFDSLIFPAVTRKDSGAGLRCLFGNFAGIDSSGTVKLLVRFPAPISNQPSGNFQDSIYVKLQDSVSNASLFYTLNQGAAQPLARGDSIKLTATVTLMAFATLGTDTSTVATFTYTKVSSGAKAGMPVATPSGGSFPANDTFSVALASTTPGATIRYTTDGSAPGTGSPALGPGERIKIQLTPAATQIKAVAFASGLNNSDMMDETYSLITPDTLAKPLMAASPGSTFSDSVSVTLQAQQTLATIFYRVNNGPLLKYSGALVFSQTTSLKAAVVSGSRASGYASWTLTRGLAAPVFSPQGQAFPDSISISISGGGTIRYTTNGRDPDSTSRVYGGPFKLDSSAEIRAVSMQSGQRSAVRSETYVLTPNPPTSIPSAGAYTDSVHVKLLSIPKARIYYTLDGSEPSPSNGIVFKDSFSVLSDKSVKAVSVAGQGSFLRQSSVFLAQYSIIAGNGTQSLGPGAILALAAGYQIRNLDVSISALVALWPSDSVKTAPGFENVRFALNLQPASGTVFPKLQLQGVSDSLGLYMRVPGSTGVRYIGPAVGTEILVAGVYFIGTDTLPPRIQLSQEIILPSDSTQATFTLTDNVINVSLNIIRSDVAPYSVSATTPEARNIALKNPSGTFRALTLRVLAFDGRNTSAFPPPPAERYSLTQKVTGGVAATPWALGQDMEQPWDFVGLPFLADPPLKLKDLRDANGNAFLHLTAMAYEPDGNGFYRILASDENLPAGKALWLANDKPVGSVKFPAFKTSPGDSQPLTLKPGWNALSNSRFDTLFWPVTRRAPGYAQSNIKGLLAYQAASDQYVATDTLTPWRGYWVYSFAQQDTALKLLPNLPPAPKAAAHAEDLGLSLITGRGAALYLGAGAGFSDAFGREDEPMMPGAVNGPWAALLRGKRALMTDQIIFRPGAPLEWRLILAAPATRRGAAWLQPDADEWRLPQGYELWAVSARRGMRFEIKPGAAAIRSPEGFADTLRLVAAPAAWIEANLGGVPTRVSGFGHRLAFRPQGLELELQWPGEGSLRVELFEPSGRRLSSTALSLPEGFYRVPLRTPVGHGLMLLRLTGRAGNKPLAWTTAVPAR